MIVREKGGVAKASLVDLTAHCPLLKERWARAVVYELHSMGEERGGGAGLYRGFELLLRGNRDLAVAADFASAWWYSSHPSDFVWRYALAGEGEGLLPRSRDRLPILVGPVGVIAEDDRVLLSKQVVHHAG